MQMTLNASSLSEEETLEECLKGSTGLVAEEAACSKETALEHSRHEATLRRPQGQRKPCTWEEMRSSTRRKQTAAAGQGTLAACKLKPGPKRNPPLRKTTRSNECANNRDVVGSVSTRTRSGRPGNVILNPSDCFHKSSKSNFFNELEKLHVCSNGTVTNKVRLDMEGAIITCWSKRPSHIGKACVHHPNFWK
jgi:hypothetical protein